MLRLVHSAEPHWLDLLGGVRVKVRPFTAGLMAAARSHLDKQDLTEATAGERFVAFASAMASVAILDWEGVADQDGIPALVTPETIAALMDVWLINEAFTSKYVTPGLVLGAEKKS